MAVWMAGGMEGAKVVVVEAREATGEDFEGGARVVEAREAGEARCNAPRS